MKYVMAMTVLAFVGCGGTKNRAPAEEPVSTTQTTSIALTTAPPPPAPAPAAAPASNAPDLRDRDKQAPNAPIIATTEKDRTLGTKIRQHLEASLEDVGWNRVRMEIHDGHVTLLGELPTIADSTAVEQTVREVKGVTAVANEIELPEGMQQP